MVIKKKKGRKKNKCNKPPTGLRKMEPNTNTPKTSMGSGTRHVAPMEE
jgi:hypothetical protein